MLDVLRNGFKCYGNPFRVVFFRPNTNLNPATLERYDKNRLTVTRQVKIKTGRIPDLLLSVNGLPVVSIELKNALTGQTVTNAIHQYKSDRDPKDPLFQFTKRCLVHFAVDTEEVWMTTKLAGADTFFLPFNKGHNNGAGNPPPPADQYPTNYLWLEVLHRDSLLELLARFLHLQVEERRVPTETGIKYDRKETLISRKERQIP